MYWVEEPLHRGDYAGYAELRRRVGVKIAGGEMTREPYEFRELLERDCLDVFQPDCVCSQGISGLAPLARRVVAAGKLFTPHTWGNGIGLLANVHLTAGTAGVAGSQWLEFPYDPPEWSLDRRDYPLVAPVEAVAGWVTLGEQPGLGIALDERDAGPHRQRPRNVRLTRRRSARTAPFAPGEDDRGRGTSLSRRWRA